MTVKSSIKKVPKQHVAILHSCTQADRLQRIELILVGNGHPEDGYVFKVIEMGKEITEIKDHLTGISGIVKELHEESIGNKATGVSKEITFGRIINVAGVVIALVMMWQGYKSLLKEAKDTKSEVKITNDVLHSPVIRGIQYDPFAKDTINGTNTH